MADPVPSGGRRYVVLAVVIMLLAALPFSPLVSFKSSQHIDAQSATLDSNLPTRIEETVRKDISTWLPYINVQEVNTLNEEGDENKIFVQIKYSTTLHPTTLEPIQLDASYTAKTY